MIPTFHGLETAKRGLSTQQSALFTVAHNIANANTVGYSRQRVSFTPTNPYPGTGLNRPEIPGQIGTGVTAGKIERIRDAFLDRQYRLESNKLGYYATLADSLGKIEEIMNEPSESGLHSVMEKFWKALQDLANHTENTGAREVVASTGEMLAETINYYYNSLVRMKNEIGNQISVKTKEINTLLSQIDQLNKQIASIEPSGQLPNDLYDRRDLLVDQLSSLVNIKVKTVVPKNYGKADPSAVGVYQIELVKNDGSSYAPPVYLIHADPASGRTAVNEVKVLDENGQSESLSGSVQTVMVGEQSLPDFSFLGELGALIESFGYQDSGQVKGIYPEMIQKLHNFTLAFANEFNAVHRAGYSLGGTAPSGLDFFVFDSANPAGTIRVSQTILDDTSKIAAGLNSGDSGDNGNAALLAAIKSKNFNDYITKAQLPPNMNGTIDSYYAGIIGKLGVDAQNAIKDRDNVQVLVDSVDYNRKSISSVSLDEEMTNMITFQHAYNASARIITVIDEMIDKIINGMGIVGR